MRYLALGNLTLDEKGDWIGLGGTVAYGAWAALHFTNSVLVISKVGKDFNLDLLTPLQDLGASFLIEFNEETARFRREKGRLVMVSPGPEGYEDLPFLPENFDVIHLGPVSGELSEETVKRALKSNFVTIDAQGVLRSRVRGPIKLEDGEWLLNNRLDLVHLNLEEASFLTGLEDPREALNSLKNSFRGVLLTLGERGSLVYFEGNLWEVPALTLRLVDPTGAGDVYTASLAVLLSSGEELRDAISKSVALTSVILEHVGVPTKLVSRDEIERRAEMVRSKMKRIH